MADAVEFAWGESGRAQHGGADAVVVVDVFSFCTCVDVAVARGATVMPWVAAHRFASDYATRHGALLAASERSHDTPSLSPISLLALEPGTALVLASPNGAAVAQRAASTGATVFAACIRNAAAVAAEINSLPNARILVVAAGEKWPDGSLRPALEDLVGAGAVLSCLHGTPSAEATAAIAAYEHPAVREALRECYSARELRGRGFARDIEFALDADSSDTVPVIRHPGRFFAAA